MKLKFERYPGINCFYVRGPVEADKFKILMIGLETLIKEQTEPVIIHMGLATLSPQEAQVLVAFKKKLAAYKVTQHWISAEKGLGDFKTLEVLATRNIFNAKTKYIADRIKLDDEIYSMNEKITSTQEEIAKLGGSEESVKKIILENDMLKTQKEVLDHSLNVQHARMPLETAKPSDDKEIAEKTSAAHAELVKVVGGEVPL